MVLATAVKNVQAIQEKQSLMQAQQMLMTAVSCIAYLRNIFPEAAFEEDTVAGMKLHRLKRKSTPQVSKLLDWIEKGCFDALSKKYLKTITLSINQDPNTTSNVLEAFTMLVTYPNSKEHAALNHSGEVEFEITRNQETVLPKSAVTTRAQFEQSMTKILRTMCVMLQTLMPLPEKKYMTMQLSYYDELTPPEYQPPLFVSSVFDIGNLFNERAFSHSFDNLSLGCHNIAVTVKSNLGKLNDDQTRDEMQSESLTPPAKNAGIPIPMIISKNEPIPMKIVREQLALPISLRENDECQSLPENFDTQLTMADTQRLTLGNSQIQDTVAASKDATIQNVKPEKLKVECFCGNNDPDLDMIECDQCGNWQHTVCAGFYSNKDKRIPSKYLCFECEYPRSIYPKTMEFIRDLACFRRVLSVIFNESIKTMNELGKRLSYSWRRAQSLVDRMGKEGFITLELMYPNSSNLTPTSGTGLTPMMKQPPRKIEIIKSAAVKDKIKAYFTQDLNTFEKFNIARDYDMKLSKGINPNRKKKSMEIEDEETAVPIDVRRSPRRRLSIVAEGSMCI